MQTIVNFIPAYAAAPVSLWLLARDVDGVCERICELAAEAEVSVLVPDGHELAGVLDERLGERVRVVRCAAEAGFAYGNESAALAVLAGEKPLPSAPAGTSESARVVAGSELASAPGKRWVWPEGADAPVELDAEVSAAVLAKVAGVEAPKAVYQGFPVCEFVAGDAAHVTLASDYVRVYGPGSCMANALREVCDAARRETCGRCVFGHEGGHQLATIMADICRKKGRAGDLELMRDLLPVMQTQGLCEQGRAMARAAASCIALFAGEIERHYARKVCDAGECAVYMTYHVLPAKCVGCGACVDACEEDAIAGRARFVHVIDQKACTQCGACADACDEGAIIMAGADKPRTPPRPIPCKRR